jgi:hypothetical protein
VVHHGGAAHDDAGGGELLEGLLGHRTDSNIQSANVSELRLSTVMQNCNPWLWTVEAVRVWHTFAHPLLLEPKAPGESVLARCTVVHYSHLDIRCTASGRL